MAQFVKLGPAVAGDIDSEAASAGQVLTADGAGAAAWADAAGGGSATDITYADLVTAIGASGLTPGAVYRITDFATTHYIVDANGTPYTTGDGIIVGATEPLIVQALGADTLGSLAFSAAYPFDVLHYDWNPANWLSDASVATNGDTIIPGWRGAITFRHDTVGDNYAYYDWRNAKTRRWATAAQAWNATTGYSAGAYVEYGSAVYRALTAIAAPEPPTQNAAPDSSTAWTAILDLSSFAYWNAASGTFNGIPSAATYADLALFRGADTIGNHFEKTNRLIGINTLGASCYYNTFGPGCYYNTFGPGCGSNTFGPGCGGNTFGANCGYNTFGPDCGYNTFGAGCYSNTFGVSCYSNTFGADCYYNTFGANCGSNTFGPGCGGNTFGANCGYNTFGAGALANRTENSAISNVDFSGATHVYAGYSCELLLDAGSVARLRYIDATGAQQIVAATA